MEIKEFTGQCLELGWVAFNLWGIKRAIKDEADAMTEESSRQYIMDSTNEVAQEVFSEISEGIEQMEKLIDDTDDPEEAQAMIDSVKRLYSLTVN